MRVEFRLNLNFHSHEIHFASSGPFLVSRTGDAGCSEHPVKCAKFLPYSRSHKEYIFIKTARRWPWKLVFSKECVTTHSPNENVSKMDGAKGKNLYRIKERNVVLEPQTNLSFCKMTWRFFSNLFWI
jgi:hypothetical protein